MSSIKTNDADHKHDDQIDVLFPSYLDDSLRKALTGLEALSFVGALRLADVVDPTFVDHIFRPEGQYILLGTDSHGEDDCWCFESCSGMLTLSVGKETYERLGLVGQRLPFKGQKSQFVIRLPLRKHALSVRNAKRRDDMLKAWDVRREKEGRAPWRVRCTAASRSWSSSGPPGLDTGDCIRVSRCQVTTLANVSVPRFDLRPCPELSPEDEEDWQIEMAAVFEWIGMAGFSSQRLRAYDRTDPYVALYECPSPSTVGDVTHLRWRSFVHPELVQTIIDTALSTVENWHDDDHSSMRKKPLTKQPFVAIVSHAVSVSPVTRVDPTKDASADGPVRLPRANGEDTWCWLLTPSLTLPGEKSDVTAVDWALVECVGQYDTRWG